MLPLMALTFDPPERATMQQPPRKLRAHIVDRARLFELIVFGTLMGLGGYVSFLMVKLGGGSTGTAQAAAFAGIILAQYVNILSRRTEETIFAPSLFSNRQIWFALGISFAVVAGIVTVPEIGNWFGFEPLRAADWIWPIGGAAAYLACFEAKKALTRRGENKDASAEL